MGVRYFVAYSLRNKKPDKLRAPTERRAYYDWLYGGELGLDLHPVLAAGPNRRGEFYDTQADIPFFANWSPLVFSRDIDVLVEAAAAAATNQNVFLGGHSAGKPSLKSNESPVSCRDGEQAIVVAADDLVFPQRADFAEVGDPR